MQRISNRHSTPSSEPVIQIRYVEVPTEVVVQAPAVEPEIRYMDREVIKEVHVSSPQTVIHQEADVAHVHELVEKRMEQQKHAINVRLAELQGHQHKVFETVKTTIDMQSRALVALKAQRDIDRSRRLMLIRRLKKQRDEVHKLNLKFKLVIGMSLILTILSFIWR